MSQSQVSSEMLAKIIDGSSIPSFVIDRHHKVSHWNTAVEALTGIKREEMLGTDGQWRTFYHEKRPAMADLIVDGAGDNEMEQYYGRKCKKSPLIEGAYEAEDFFPALGKKGKWLHFTASPIRDGHGAVIGAIETLEDITERKTAQEMLSEIIDGSPIASFVINKQHLVTHWNTAIESLSGIKKQDVVGTDGQWWSFYSEKRPTLADLIVDGASTDEIDIFYRGKSNESPLIADAYEAEDFFPALGKRGQWLLFTASPIKDKNGEILGAVETLQDITERKLTREALYESERSFRDLFESALDAIWVHGVNGNIKMANAACARLTGYPLARLKQANLSLFFTPDGTSFIRKVLANLVNEQTVKMPYQQSLIRSDGTQLMVEMTTRLIVQSIHPVTFQSVARDITQEIKMRESIRYYLQKVLAAQEEERKRIARELHDDTAQLFGSLSRQLDNFIRKKHGLAPSEMLFLRDLQAQLNHGVTEVHRFSQALRSSVLDDFGLIPALRSLLKGFQESEGVNTDLKVIGEEKRYPPEVETTLFRIVQEAVNNIRKHAQASEARVTVEFAGNKIVMTVSDNGRGFELKESLEELPRSGKLGLAGIQERARLLGGTVRVDSAPGKGTTLVVECPVG